MRQPSVKNLKIDQAGTKKIHAALAQQKSLKITIHVDMGSLAALKEIARNSGIPYQKLFNTLVGDSLDRQESIQTRLSHLEQELKKMKRQIAA